jgi:hypothetical protein
MVVCAVVAARQQRCQSLWRVVAGAASRHAFAGFEWCASMRVPLPAQASCCNAGSFLGVPWRRRSFMLPLDSIEVVATDESGRGACWLLLRARLTCGPHLSALLVAGRAV